MARKIAKRDNSSVIEAAHLWIMTCLVEDGSVFSKDGLWTAENVSELYNAFVEHPREGDESFIIKLKDQIQDCSAPAQRLMAEMLWALLLFPSNMKAQTKRKQVHEIAGLAGEKINALHPMLSDEVLIGIGSGGIGFYNYRPDELAFLLELVRDMKAQGIGQRRAILTDYDQFVQWIGKVRQEGNRQLRHMLRYFAFPDRVERMSSNRDRRKILEGYEVAVQSETKKWDDKRLDEALLSLRERLQAVYPETVLDFYETPLREKWAGDRKIKTVSGELTVTVPRDEDEQDESDTAPSEVVQPPDARQSLQMQAKLTEIGAKMGFSIWLPRADKGRVLALVPPNRHSVVLQDLPLNYDETTLDTIEQIDVIWLRGRSIVRAFEVEHTTAVYSGLLRMADLLALQPNMDIKLHIVAPYERRDKFFREMLRPVFSLLERGPLSRSCTFLSYDSIDEIAAMEHLAFTTEGILSQYEEPATPA